ncbi:MAG: amino acid adenylation domain-containing protein, partial [Acidobacteria bacterium]|nr:amino acid adenylation domain-containing protein [Acidobacteriota bacterium]
NNTQRDYPWDKTIHQLFAGQVLKIPDRIALVGADLCVCPARNARNVSLTYRELNGQSDKFAGLLMEKGVQPDCIVGIMVERSVEMIIALIGILKSGGAYLPIDPYYPPERIAYMLKDSGAKWLAVANELESEKVGKYEGEKVLLESIFYDSNHIKECPRRGLQHANLAYVIYTSGSTGKPKGVAIAHKSVINLIEGVTDIIPFMANDRVLSLTTISFDIFGLETWVPLVKGSMVVIGDREKQLNPKAASIVIEQEDISIFQVTPSRLQMMISIPEVAVKLKIIKFLLVGGEIFPMSFLEKIKTFIHGKIFNMYGPTETTIWSTVKNVNIDMPGDLNIGKPIANTSIYILDEKDYPVPTGVPGVLYIGGDGLARGYLNNPELTAEKFGLQITLITQINRIQKTKINKSFYKGLRGAVFSKRAPLVYKTGDLARWLPDGNIEFLGRIDHQVKIRGFRIELGEIETQLLGHAQIKEAVVIIKETSGDKHLCAYVVPGKEGKELSISGLREYLTRKLPDYMIPSYFVWLEAIPLTVNGKLDVAALPDPEIKIEGVYVAPRDEVEKKLVEMWSEILRVEAGIIGIDANFFELGGHSLSGTVLTANIHKAFEIKLALADLFRMPTIRKLAQLLEKSQKVKFNPIEPVEEKEYYPLSSAQKRLYILQELEQENNIYYNMPFAFSVQRKLDIAKLNSIFKKLIARHESFKTSFEMLDDEPVQRIHQTVDFNIETYELRETTIPAIKRAFVRVFDLSKAPLLRVGVIKINEDNYILMIDMHHIVSDGVSINIILKDFSALYYDKELQNLAIQYKDYSEWQKTERQKELLKKQEAYWLKKFAGEIPLLNLPTDYARPVVQQFKGDIINFSLDEQLTNKIRELEKTSESTLFILLLSIFNVLLVRYSGQEDIIVGTLTTGRSHIELAGIVGVLLNMLPIRTFPAKNKYFFDYIAEVKKETLDAFENSDYQYDELLEKIRIDRNIGRNPLYDVMLILQNIEMDKELLDDMGIKNFGLERTIALLDLRLVVEAFGTGLILNLEYSTSLFKPETILQMIRHMIKIIREVTANPKRKILEYDLLEEEEKNRILNEFNGLKVHFPQDKTIHHYVEAWADQLPDHIAVVYEGNQITYHHLNLLANRLTWNSRKLGKSLDHLAIILLDRSLEMVLAIISVWKCGGAYVPIDTKYPINRVREIIEDSQAGVLISNRRYVTPGVEKELKCEMVFPGEILFASEKEWDSDHPISYFHTNMHSLSYIIYTSGSTGKPKGAMIEHIGMMNHIHAKIHDLQITSWSIIAQNASHTFDISVWQFFAAFAAGGKTLIFPDKIILDIGTFIKQIVGHSVTLLEVVPSYLTVLLDTIEGQSDLEPALQFLLVTGEVLKPILVKRWFKKFPAIKLVNAYGPTEASD